MQMKKFICIIMTLALFMGMTVSAYATQTITFDDDGNGTVTQNTDEQADTSGKKGYIAFGADLTPDQKATVLAFMGILPDGTIDVLWGKRMTASLDHVGEAKETLHWMNFFKADTIAHDYTGAGALRETFLLEAGVPEDATVPIMYVPSAKYNLMTLIPPTQNHGRRYFRSDKTRTLLYVIGCLKQGKLRFFQYDGGAASAGTSLMDDFLALIEEKSGGLTGNETYCINRNHAVPDDFAHAVAFGCLTLWHVTGNWPNFAISQQPDATEVGYSYDEMLDDQWDVSV